MLWFIVSSNTGSRVDRTGVMRFVVSSNTGSRQDRTGVMRSGFRDTGVVPNVSLFPT